MTDLESRLNDLADLGARADTIDEFDVDCELLHHDLLASREDMNPEEFTRLWATFLVIARGQVFYLWQLRNQAIGEMARTN